MYFVIQVAWLTRLIVLMWLFLRQYKLVELVALPCNVWHLYVKNESVCVRACVGVWLPSWLPSHTHHTHTLWWHKCLRMMCNGSVRWFSGLGVWQDTTGTFRVFSWRCSDSLEGRRSSLKVKLKEHLLGMLVLLILNFFFDREVWQLTQHISWYTPSEYHLFSFGVCVTCAQNDWATFRLN